jgi:hypothetical protein
MVTNFLPLQIPTCASITPQFQAVRLGFDFAMKAVMHKFLMIISLFLAADAMAADTLKQVAPGVVINIHCLQKSYPNFWRALQSVQLKKGRVTINADLALSDVQPEARSMRDFRDKCLIALLQEHLRPTLDEALHILILQSDQRIEDRKWVEMKADPGDVENAAYERPSQRPIPNL